MKTIGIISDTHAHWDEKYALHLKGCDEIWHAGDIGSVEVLDRLKRLGPTVRAVYGNADGSELRRMIPDTRLFNVDGLRVLLTHIGGYPGNYARGMATALAEHRPGLMVCGHSHILRVMPDKRLGLLHINPGAAGLMGWQKVRTLVRLTIDEGTPKSLEVIELSPQRGLPGF